MVWMYPDGAPNMRIFIRYRRYLFKLAEAGANGLHSANSGLGSTRQHAVHILGEVFKVQMAMAID
jgi:hypothetical protein